MISIIIPTYNCATFLPACLDSIRAQTIQDKEILVIDDGSTDDTSKVMLNELKKGGIASYHHCNVRHGANPARNQGLRICRGQYVLFADADSILHPQMLEKTLNALKTHPKAAYAYCALHWCGLRNEVMPAREFDVNFLRHTNFISMMSLIRRDVLTELDELITRFQDWDIWLTLLEQGKCGTPVNEVLFDAYVRTDGISNRSDYKTAYQAIVRKHPRTSGFRVLEQRSLTPAAVVDFDTSYTDFCMIVEDAIKNQTAFSHVRVGDGENLFLAFPEVIKYPDINVRMQNTGVQYPDPELKQMLIESLIRSEVVGITPHHHEAFKPFTAKIFIHFGINPIRKVDVFAIYRMVRDGLFLPLLSRKRVLVVGHEALLLKHLWGLTEFQQFQKKIGLDPSTIIAAIGIPKTQCGKVRKELYEKILSLDYDVCLISAGVLGTALPFSISRIKRCPVIDFGHMLKALVGDADVTRPHLTKWRNFPKQIRDEIVPTSLVKVLLQNQGVVLAT